MNAKTHAMRTRCMAVLCALAACSSFVLCPVAAQVPKKADAADQETPKKGIGKEPRKLSVFTLKYASAADVMNFVNGIFEANVGADQRTNSVLAYAPAADMNQIEELISRMEEIAKNSSNDTKTKVWTIPLKHAEAVQAVTEVLQIMFKGWTDWNFNVNSTFKTVTLKCDRATFEEAAKLVQTLDQPLPIRSTSQNVQVRVAWLAAGNNGQIDAMEVPPNLKEILPQLAMHGIVQPRLIAQTFVNATADARFQATGIATLGEAGSYTFAVTGQFIDEEMKKMDISIVANEVLSTNPKAPNDLARITTQINAPAGQTIVLGIAPTGAMTSVFAIQVIRPKQQK